MSGDRVPQWEMLWIDSSQAVSGDSALPTLLVIDSTTIDLRGNSGNAPAGDLPENIGPE